jgi:hypothetical protein
MQRVDEVFLALAGDATPALHFRKRIGAAWREAAVFIPASKT